MSNLYPGITNSGSGSGLYPGMIVGIDLRREMDILMAEYGYYVILRHFDRSRHSSYWDDIAKEAVGGPAYEYTDYIARARKVVRASLSGTGGLEEPTPLGLITLPYIMFYVKWNAALRYEITNADEIMEFTNTSTGVPGLEDALKSVTNTFNILLADDLLGDLGRREYYACVSRLDIGGR
jgi:hypothetical protein